MIKGLAVQPKKMPLSVSFTEKEIKGINTLKLDDKVSLRLECKVNEISRNEYDKGNPISMRFSVMSVKILDSEIVSKIKNAKTNAELESIMEE